MAARRSEQVKVWIVLNDHLAARYTQLILSRSQRFLMKIQEEPNQSVLGIGKPALKGTVLITDLAAILEHSRSGHYPQNQFTLAIGPNLLTADFWQLVRLGIRGFVCHGHLEDEIRPAVVAVAQGELWYTSSVIRQCISAAQMVSLPGVDTPHLTAQEERIVSLLQFRLSNKEIGCRLGISERTVRFHLSNVFAKLNVHDRHSALDSHTVRDLLKAQTVQ